MPFVGDARLVMRRGMMGATGNHYVGLLEFEDMGFLLHFLRPNDLFVDVGANVGVYSVLAAKVCGARAIALEPIPSTVQALRDNLAINGIGERVEVAMMAAGSEAGHLTFTSERDAKNHVLEDGADGLVVPVARLDDVVGAEIPALVKIDVEGYERPALEGAQRLLGDARCRALILELDAIGARYGHSDAEVDSLVREHGFAPVRYDPLTRALTQVAPKGKGNTLYVRDRDAVAERLRSAAPFRVLGRSI
jgi:FkbM family methyltransferase